MIKKGNAMVDPEIERFALKRFKDNKLMTADELADLMYCSVPTVRNRLRKWRTFTSYNKNGKYYVLPSIPKFDDRGLWKYRSVFFSRHGNLTRTVQWLVCNSPSGMYASDLAEALGLSARSFVSHLRKISQLCREAYGQKSVYFCAEEPIYQKQKSRREEAIVPAAVALPAEADAILILVDRIKHPDSSAEQTAARLRKAGKRISVRTIRNLLAHHSVEKKTPDTTC